MSTERLHDLVGGLLDDRLSASGREELLATLRSSAAARRVFWELIDQEVLLRDVVCESAGRDLARMAANDLSVGEAFVEPCPAAVSSRGPWATSRSAGRLLAALVALVVLAVPLVGSAWWLREGSRPGEPVATFRSLAGEVWLTNARHKGVQATAAQGVHAGDRVHVGEEGGAELLLADGSRVCLGARSVLNFDGTQASAKSLRLECGSADVQAAPQPPESPLVFHTNQARLTVLGTRFRLYAGQGDSRVELEEGKVQFERRSDGRSVEVGAGQYAVAIDHEGPSQPPEARALSAEWRLRHTLLNAGSLAAFAHDGLHLATCHRDGLRVWDVATGEVRQTVEHRGSVARLAFAAADDAIVAIGNDGNVARWVLDGGRLQTQELASPLRRLRRCNVSTDGRWLAQTSADDAGYLPIWRVGDAGEITLVRSISKRMTGVAIVTTPSGPQVAAANQNGTVIVWDALTGDERFRHRFASQCELLALSDDGRLLCGFSRGSGLMLFDIASGRQTSLWSGNSVGVQALRFTTDGREVFAAMADGVVRAWSTEPGEASFVLSTGDATVAALDVATDGRWLATCGPRGAVKVWQRRDN
jgi:WD40 repeat protein